MNRRACVLAALALFGGAAVASARDSGKERAPAPPGEWRVYGADHAGSRYSPLDQINASNFRQLRLAWRWDSVDNPILRERYDLKPGPNEATPLMIGGVLYTSTSLNQVAAIDAATGQTLWVYNPESYGGVHRGLAYWPGNGKSRLYLTTNDSYLIALDLTGKPIRAFGTDGRVDLTKGLRRPVNRKIVSVTSPPIVCGDVVVVGGSVDDFQDRKLMPPGDVRGFDARSGKLLWTFHTIPQEGEFGNDTWENESWKYVGAANVWTLMSYDPELGYVYLPVSTPSNDWYGGHRHGAGLFGESLVCLDAKTGKRVWHFQLVHHGVWDYDLPCAPNLIDVTVNGRRVKAVAQVTKQAFCYVFDRVTGKPLWPIEERPVPQSTMPGEKTWPTQPFPTKPKAFDLQGARGDDLIDFTPELRSEAERLLKTWHHGQLYTPPTEKMRTLLVPGWVGGASWAGAASDPETGILYVPSVTKPMWLTLAKPTSYLADVRYKIDLSGYENGGPEGLPLFKPPWGRITAIDLNSGDHQWMVPSGTGPKDHPALRGLDLPERLGNNQRTYTVVTKTLLITAQEGSWFNGEPPSEAPMLRAYDKATGRLLGEVRMPRAATGAPITYLANGKQFIVVPVGGANMPAELLAFGLL